MSYFTPVKLAGKNKTASVADLETSFKRLADVLGGSAYSGGSAYTVAAGTLNNENFAADAGITNDQKEKPYVLCVQQIFFKSASISTPAEIAYPAIDDSLPGAGGGGG